MNSPADVPAALSAFLRGVERRGVILAELQCGRRETGEIALAAALRAFRQYAGEQPMAQWPRGFWSLLVAAPPLRQAHPEARWPQDLDWLADLSDTDRMALLLRLVAGLDEGDAATAMDLDQAGYRAALTRACPRDGEGQPDPQGWRDLAEAIQQHLRALSPERQAHLSRLRETLGLGDVPEAPEAAPPAAMAQATPEEVVEARTPGPEIRPSQRAKRPFPWRTAVVALLVLCALAAGVVWWKHGFPGRAGAGDGSSVPQASRDPAAAKVEVLSAADAPKARFSASQAAASHPDLDLLMDPQGLALARQADFLAWYAAAPEARQREAAQPLPLVGQEAVDGAR